MVLPGCWFFTWGKMKHFELTTWQPVIRSVHNQIGDSDDRAVCEIKNVVSDKFSHLCRKSWLCMLVTSTVGTNKSEYGWETCLLHIFLLFCLTITAMEKYETGWETTSSAAHFLLFSFTITTMGCNRLA